MKKLAGVFKAKEVNDGVAEILDDYSRQLKFVKEIYETKRGKVTEGDDLPPGVIKMVKVYLAVKRKLAVGDKMAGRHGNKGVVSNILPYEDLPFFADGRPVDIVLNPLGVPSRMNIGQIMETHLGWAAKELGYQLAEMLDQGAHVDALRKDLKGIFEAKDMQKLIDGLDDDDLLDTVRRMRGGIVTRTPVFDGAEEQEIWDLLKKAELPRGRQGRALRRAHRRAVQEPGHRGHHVHAEAPPPGRREDPRPGPPGPYSLVTQQPLGGKAQFGGQRLGEMEVWALEAYGAAYLLQEFLTVKSDDVGGRVKMYEKIVKGRELPGGRAARVLQRPGQGTHGPRP